LPPFETLSRSGKRKTKKHETKFRVFYGWGSRIRTYEMTEPKPVALPLGYTPLYLIFIYRLGINFGRDDRIRTCDPLIPNQVRYQTALHPDSQTIPNSFFIIP
jgi:hypothetical protein